MPKVLDFLLCPDIVVRADYEDESYLTRVQKNSKAIEKVWDQAQIHRKLFNGTILNLAKIQYSRSAVLLCHPVEYKHYLAQKSGVDLGLTPLGVSGIVFYKQEGKDIFLVGKRSTTVSQYPGFYEFTPSGSIDVNEGTSEKIDYTRQILVELKEELGITKTKLCQAFCIIFDEVDRVYDIGIELEIDSSTHIRLQEYSSIEKLPFEAVSECMKRQNVVPTSKKLFDAWQAHPRGGSKNA